MSCRGGSSPRPRGTLSEFRALFAGLRFIPASAGNTRSDLTDVRLVAVHPRVRGEHATPRCSFSQADGSSPRPRGTRITTYHIPTEWRFIPASAGNTNFIGGVMRLDTVHPRVRGEHVALLVVAVMKTGSSPRPRGTLGVVHFAEGLWRFIPASAGNTPASPRRTK